VQLVGRVFRVERDTKGTYMQVWMDAKNSDQNTIVGYKDPAFQVNQNDYVTITGEVGKKFEGENALGASLTVPPVLAESVRVVNATAAATPAHTTYGSSPPLAQGGVRIIVPKIEAASDETRVFVRVSNLSDSGFSFYSSSAKLVANGQSIAPNYSGDYPEPTSDVASHSRTSGVIVFKPIPRNASLRLILEGYSDKSNVGKYGSLTWTFTWR
jgi:hypothetical protein